MMQNIQTSVWKYEQFLFARLLTESEETDEHKYICGCWEARGGCRRACKHRNVDLLYTNWCEQSETWVALSPLVL